MSLTLVMYWIRQFYVKYTGFRIYSKGQIYKLYISSTICRTNKVDIIIFFQHTFFAYGYGVKQICCVNDCLFFVIFLGRENLAEDGFFQHSVGQVF